MKKDFSQLHIIIGKKSGKYNFARTLYCFSWCQGKTALSLGGEMEGDMNLIRTQFPQPPPPPTFPPHSPSSPSQHLYIKLGPGGGGLITSGGQPTACMYTLWSAAFYSLVLSGAFYCPGLSFVVHLSFHPQRRAYQRLPRL